MARRDHRPAEQSDHDRSDKPAQSRCHGARPGRVREPGRIRCRRRAEAAAGQGTAGDLGRQEDLHLRIARRRHLPQRQEDDGGGREILLRLSARPRQQGDAARSSPTSPRSRCWTRSRSSSSCRSPMAPGSIPDQVHGHLPCGLAAQGAWRRLFQVEARRRRHRLRRLRGVEAERPPYQLQEEPELLAQGPAALGPARRQDDPGGRDPRRLSPDRPSRPDQCATAAARVQPAEDDAGHHGAPRVRRWAARS